MRELRDSESSINSLHRQLRTLSRMLNEARVILEDKQHILDVEEYLKSCEVENGKLARIEGLKVQKASEKEGTYGIGECNVYKKEAEL